MAQHELPRPGEQAGWHDTDELLLAAAPAWNRKRSLGVAVAAAAVVAVALGGTALAGGFGPEAPRSVAAPVQAPAQTSAEPVSDEPADEPDVAPAEPASDEPVESPDDTPAEQPAAEPDGGSEPAVAPGSILDPEAPWALRGDASLLENGNRETFSREWAVLHNVQADTVTFLPLYAQAYESAGSDEVVFLARSGSGAWYWGVVASSEGGPRFYQDIKLEAGTKALAATLPGDEGSNRLLVLAAPAAGAALHAADGKEFAPMTELTGGVWIAPTTGESFTDRYKVLDGDGDLDAPLVEAEAPNYANAG